MRVEGQERLVQAAINGGRARAEHPALPITADQQAAESSAAVAREPGPSTCMCAMPTERERRGR